RCSEKSKIFDFAPHKNIEKSTQLGMLRQFAPWRSPALSGRGARACAGDIFQKIRLLEAD
ncbi:MAG: hypothetical protein VX596_04380, partial [Pseudomonadota bacterium]|nr:hypothetical protein [Pseudomonadota bacterium]